MIILRTKLFSKEDKNKEKEKLSEKDLINVAKAHAKIAGGALVAAKYLDNKAANKEQLLELLVEQHPFITNSKAVDRVRKDIQGKRWNSNSSKVVAGILGTSALTHAGIAAYKHHKNKKQRKDENTKN